MKKLILTTLVLLMGIALQAQEVTVEFKGMKTVAGKLYVAVVDANNKEIRAEIVDVTAKTVKLELGVIQAEAIGIRVYHDANSNGKMDTGFMGIPTEAYGFSKDARGTFGPPELSEYLVSLKEGNNLLVINLE
jgi:uncharacterized protein (DUF2141 family)